MRGLKIRTTHEDKDSNIEYDDNNDLLINWTIIYRNTN